MSDSPTRDLVIPVSATHLTDPDEARRLAYALSVLVAHEQANGDLALAGFLDDLRGELRQYADELQGAHDQVVRDVMHVWGPTLDNGPIDPGEG